MKKSKCVLVNTWIINGKFLGRTRVSNLKAQQAIYRLGKPRQNSHIYKWLLKFQPLSLGTILKTSILKN